MRAKISKVVCSVLLGGMVAMGLTACGSSNYNMSESASDSYKGAINATEYESAAVTEEAYDTSAYDESDSGTGDIQDGNVQENQSDLQNRKLIRNYNYSVQTTEFDELIANVEQKVASLGGYIQDSYVSGQSYYSTYSTRDSSYTIRIPESKALEFTEHIENASNVISRSENVEDITLQYVDVESRRAALDLEYERLMALLEQADSIETIIALETRLTEVRYDLQNMTSRLRTYDNLVSYATINLNIQEVERLTDIKPESDFERMINGFKTSVYNVLHGLKNFVINFIIAIPFLIVWAIIIGGIFLFVRFIVRRKKRKSEEKYKAERASMGQQVKSEFQEEKQKEKE